MALDRSTLNARKAGLPDGWPELLDELASTVLDPDAPLRLALVGEFSVGKSRLLNMLMGQELLYTAPEEATTLPTFIEFGPEPRCTLGDAQGQVATVDAATFRQPGPNWTYAALEMPLPWLEGVAIVDLPGLGSMSQSRRDYTLAQIRQADAVLYLVLPKGPGREDLATLTQLRLLGKRVKVVVAQWHPEQFSKETAPDLEALAATIQQKTGLRTRLQPVNKDGLGREDVLAFIARSKNEVMEIRQRRFRVELEPLVRNALGENAQGREAVQERSERQCQDLQLELSRRKDALLALKVDLAGQRHGDVIAMDERCAGLLKEWRQNLEARLGQVGTEAGDQNVLDAMLVEGAEAVTSSLTTLAEHCHGLSEGYGRVNLTPAQVEAFNLRMPAMATVSVEEFLDLGLMANLEDELQRRQGGLATLEAKLEALEREAEDCSGDLERLRALLNRRDELAGLPLPMAIRLVDDGIGRGLGRVLGELADIGLFFVNPTAVGAKAAALVGKGAAVAGKAARAAGMAVKASEVAKVTSKVKDAIVTTTETSHALLTRNKDLPKGVLDKLGKLEMLSLGYWGERIGAFLDGPREVWEIDPVAKAEQDAAMAGLRSEIDTLQWELDRKTDVLYEQDRHGRESERIQGEMATLKAKLAEKQAQAQARAKAAQEALHTQQETQFHRLMDQARTRWLRGFDIQSRGMAELLRQRVKRYWEERVESMLERRVEDVAEQAAQCAAAPSTKAAELARLEVENQALGELLKVLA